MYDVISINSWIQINLFLLVFSQCESYLIEPTIRDVNQDDLQELNDYLNFEIILPSSTVWPKYRAEMKDLDFSSISKDSSQRFHPKENKRSPLTSALSPCTLPLPGSRGFSDFCQWQYHQSESVCDPGSLLSRTESELLDSHIEAMNMTGCICKNCKNDNRPSVGIIIVSLADWTGFQDCPDFTPPHSKPSAAILYASVLAEHWSQVCRPDLLLVYIERWTGEQTHRPYLVPIYQNDFARLYSRARPILVRGTNQLLEETRNALSISRNIMNHPFLQFRTSIPTWAVSLTLSLIGFVCVSIYAANYITTKLGNRKVKKKSSVSSMRSHRLRPGMGGGLMMAESRLITPVRKSTMMFRSFNKSRYASIPTSNRI